MSLAIYNEIDPYACAWLENLITAGHVAPGRVERRSVADLTPDDVRGPGQRHFFAGIGGWSLALRLAGVPDDADVWTGSCPCQPFSDAGKRTGVADERHLWPAWFRLIRECRPALIFGEQVASKEVIGDQGEGLRVPAEVSAYASREGLDSSRPTSIGGARLAFRSRFARAGHSDAYQLGLLRGDRSTAESRRRPDVGQPFDRSRESGGRLHLFEHSDRLPRSEQRDGRLGRTEDHRDGTRDSGTAEVQILDVVDAIGRGIAEESGGAWLDVVQSDLESAGYAVGAAVLAAASVGAPHIRQRLYFVAHARGERFEGKRLRVQPGQSRQRRPEAGGAARLVGDASGSRSGRHAGAVSDAETSGPGQGSGVGRVADEPVDAGATRIVADGDSDGCETEEASWQERAGGGRASEKRRSAWPTPKAADIRGGGLESHGRQALEPSGPRPSDHWRDVEWIACTDGKQRPISAEPRIFPLAPRLSGRVAVRRTVEQADATIQEEEHWYNAAGVLAGSGNSIVPQLAAVFIRCAEEARRALK